VSFKKNTAVTGFTVGLVSATDGSDITTGTPVGYYTIDGGTQTAIGDVTPVHEGNGQWSFDLTAGEMNGDVVGLVFTHATGITVQHTIKTVTELVSDLNDVVGPTVSEFNARTLLAASYFDPAADTVANVTTVATTTTNTDMRGTDSAATATALATVDTNIDTILVDTNDLQTNQGNWATATGFSTFDHTTDTVANVTTVATTTTNTDMRGTDSAATASELAIVDANVDSILVDTGTSIPADIAALNDISVSEVLTTQMTESYATDGTAPTLAQALMLIQQSLGDFAISGTTITVKKVDGATTAATFTLDDGTNPTSTTRAS